MAHLDDCFQGVCACGQRRIQDEETPRRAPKRRQPQRKYVASAFPLPASPGYATVHRWAHIAVSHKKCAGSRIKNYVHLKNNLNDCKDYTKHTVENRSSENSESKVLCLVFHLKFTSLIIKIIYCHV